MLLVPGESRPFHGCVGSWKHLEIAVGIAFQIARCWSRGKILGQNGEAGGDIFGQDEANKHGGWRFMISSSDEPP